MCYSQVFRLHLQPQHAQVRVRFAWFASRSVETEPHLSCSLGFLGIVLTDKSFYRIVDADPEINITIDVAARIVSAADETFSFELSEMEIAMLDGGGGKYSLACLNILLLKHPCSGGDVQAARSATFPDGR